MKITFTPSFKAKNQNIRKADDIQRNAKLSFPFISPSYCDSFYQTSKRWQPDIKAKYNNVMMSADKKLSAIRLLAKESAFEGSTFDERNTNAPIFQTLRGIRILKTANCHECAALTMAALAANGIHDIERVNLKADIEYINKKTKEKEYSANIPVDHTTIIAKMGDKKKNKVVVDSWIGFADSESSAKAKYKQLMWDSDIKEKIRMHRSLFRIEKFEQTGTMINPEKDYELKVKIGFEKAEETTQENMRLIGYYTSCFYPELIMMPQKTDANN